MVKGITGFAVDLRSDHTSQAAPGELGDRAVCDDSCRAFPFPKPPPDRVERERASNTNRHLGRAGLTMPLHRMLLRF